MKDSKVSAINVTGGLAIRGLIDMDIKNTIDNVEVHYKNTITNAGKQFLLAASAGIITGIGAEAFGSMTSLDAIRRITASSADLRRLSLTKGDLTLCLLNLPDSALQGLQAGSTYIPVFGDTFASADNLLGYANGNINPAANGKEGALTYPKADYIASAFTVGKRWKFAEGVATGSFNCIAMIPSAAINSPQGDGFKISKCLEQVNINDANFGSLSTGFLIPGVPGYTSNNEVLLNFSRDGISRWKYNLQTGEMSQVADSDPFFVVTPGECCDMQVIDGYLYVIKATASGRSISVTVYDPANSMAQVASFSCSGKSSTNPKVGVNIFKVDNDIYVSQTGANNAIAGAYVLWKLNKTGSNNYASSAGTGMEDYSAIGLTVPTGVPVSKIGIGTYKGAYVMYLPSLVANPTNADYIASGGSIGYVFTDLTNPVASIIDTVCCIQSNECLFTAGSNFGSMRIGDHKSTGSYYDAIVDNRIVINNEAGSKALNTRESGVYISMDKWSSQVFSFVKLNAPVSKTQSDVIHVSYNYNVVT